MKKFANVLTLCPETLADTVNPAIVEEALCGLTAITDEQQKVLVYALTYWVVKVIERPTDKEGVLLLDRICAIAIRLSSRVSDAKFCAQLQIFRELLETKRQAIATRLSGSRPRQAERVLTLLRANGSLSQTALAERLRLSIARVNQLVAVMEERGLVRCAQRGRECCVSVPPSLSKGE